MESSLPAKFGLTFVKKPNNDIYLTPAEGGEHKFTLIWMHGLGDSSEGFLDFFYAKNPVLSNNVTSRKCLT
jgi:predicted esterase